MYYLIKYARREGIGVNGGVANDLPIKLRNKDRKRSMKNASRLDVEDN